VPVEAAINRAAGSSDKEETRGNRTAADAKEVTMNPSSARILVIDDEQDILDLVADILDANGFTVDTARCGSLGLVKLAENRFDLLLCDVGMHEMNGWEVVERVRKTDPVTGVVLVTGWGSTLSEDDARHKGVDAILGKPFEMRTLVGTVERVLGVCQERAGTGAA